MSRFDLPPRRLRRPSLLAVVVFLGFATTAGWSADIQWTGAASDGKWSTPGNWWGVVVPGPSDNALFSTFVGSQTVIADGNPTVAGLTAGSGTSQVTLNVPSGSTFTLFGPGTVTGGSNISLGGGIFKNTGTLTVSGGQLRLMNGAILNQGDVTLQNSAIVS